MGTITYTYTIVNAHWFDANPVMSNFLTARDEINGELNEDNLLSTSDLTISKLIVGEFLSTPLIDNSTDLVLNLFENKNITFNDSSSNQLLKISAGEVVIGG